jgi:DNA polymerase
LAALRDEVAGCTQCTLSSARETVVFGEGNPAARLVFVGDMPGSEEEKQEIPFAGDAGNLLTNIIVKGMGLKRKDVYLCTVLKCRCDRDMPDNDQVTACEQILIRQLQAIRPRVIVSLGENAAKFLLKTDKGINDVRGVWHAYRGIPLMPTFHPAELVKEPADKKFVWEDIQKVMAKLGVDRS